MFRQARSKLSNLVKSSAHQRISNDARCSGDRDGSSEPLRILFCGADDFSIYSLRAINGLRDERPDKIATIDVVCRPDKRVGRGLKQIQEVPIKNIAKGFNLPIHQIDTFTGWSPPSPIDLIIAVSFGLLVPGRILQSAKYGGLNIHPSLLPNLRGPAPIQHALLHGLSHTGVTLQTMHPTNFDHGMILDQSPLPGIPITETTTVEQLNHTLGLAGAEMLREAVMSGLFVRPAPLSDLKRYDQISHAPKISPEDRQIDWATWTAKSIIRRDRILGRLWDNTTYQACHAKGPKRATFDGPWREVPREEIHDRDQGYIEGVPTLSHVDGPRKARLAFYTVDKKLVSPETVTIEGEQKGKGMAGLVQAVKASYSDGVDSDSVQHRINVQKARIWY